MVRHINALLVSALFPLAVLLQLVRLPEAPRAFGRVSPILVLAVGILLVPALGRAAEGGTDPQAFVQSLAQTAITTVADGKLSDADRQERFRQLFVSTFDLPEIGRFVLARYWRTAAPEQQQEFLALFQDFVVLTWAGRFTEYNGESLSILGTAPEGDHDWLVESRIERQRGPAIPVQWRLRREDDGQLRVVDIIVENVSMAVTLRSDYGAALQANGGQVSALLASLRSKVAQLKSAR